MPQEKTSQLPGVNSNDVKPSNPQMINESFQNEKKLNTDTVTRFEVIDHTKEMLGRAFVKYGVNVELSFQDDNKTLKVFLTDK